MKKHLALSIVLSACSGLVAAEPNQSILVPGSQDHDFGVVCTINGNVTFSVRKNHHNNGYRIARDIYLTDVGGGKVAISMMRGFIRADARSTYVAATGESCETFSQ